MNNITDIVEKLKLNATTKNVTKEDLYKFFPEDYNELKEIVNNLIKERGENANLNDIDTSKITDMSELFKHIKNGPIKNIDISKWDVRQVKNMDGMFALCREFNCDLSTWNPINLESCKSMFSGCKAFNSYIFSNTPKLSDTSRMFNGCESFNKDISKLKTLNLTNAEAMFENCTNFNIDISNWKLPKIRNINWMFSCCISFNQDLSKWKIPRSVAMIGTFLKCKNLHVIPLWFKRPLNI